MKDLKDYILWRGSKHTLYIYIIYVIKRYNSAKITSIPGFGTTEYTNRFMQSILKRSAR